MTAAAAAATQAQVAATQCSYDVFDTVLTRRTGRPETVFDVAAARLVEAGDLPAPTAAFTTARRTAETRLHTLTARPPRLREVYDQVVHELNLPPELAERFARCEEDVERELVVAVPGADELLSAGREQSRDGRLVFVSDTPHSVELVRELLDGQGLLQPGDRVFTSADTGASKSRGGLFTRVAAALGTPAAQFRHVGDNEASDVAAARAEGWRAERRADAALNRYEHLLERRPADAGAFVSWVAGASRLARLRARRRGLPAGRADVAAGVMAPVLIGYSIWLAAQARQRGLTRLYFVARDGEVLLEVARPVLAALAPEVECRYLYGSRRAWFVAAAALSDDLRDAWLEPKPDSTLRTAVERAGLDLEQVWSQTGEPWADPARADVPLTPEAAREVSDALRREPLRSIVLPEARGEAELALDYLRQEGLSEQRRSGVVDLGWRGRSARALDVLVRAVGGSPVDHLFFGLYAASEVRAVTDPPEMSSWLFDWDEGRSPDTRPLERPNVVMEMFCAGTEGSLVGYRRDGDQVLPVLAQPQNALPLRWGLRDVRAVVDDVVSGCVGALTQAAMHIDLVTPSWDLLQAFWMRPTRAEAQAWGSYPWEEETFPPVYPIAERLSAGAAVRRIVRRRQGLRFNSWPAGSTQLQDEPWRTILRLRAFQLRQGPRLAAYRRRAQLALARRRG